MKTQATAKLRSLRISPRKVRLVVDLIRGRELNDALLQLEFSIKHAAKPVLKLLKSAIANAVHNHNIDESTLVIEKITVDGGPTLHRFMPRAMGRAFKIRKRTSHITLILAGEASEEVKKDEKVSEAKVEVEETTKKVSAKKVVKKTSAKKVTKPAKAAKVAKEDK
jgi:large subunit ribosomal protein L22